MTLSPRAISRALEARADLSVCSGDGDIHRELRLLAQGRAHYDEGVSAQTVPGGVVHALPADLQETLAADAAVLDTWLDITPLARNEFICWVEDAKQQKTRERRIRRTREELEEGKRRPCCWPGCKHRERTGRA